MAENKPLLEVLEQCGHFLHHRRGGKHGQAKILRILAAQGSLSQRRLQDTLCIKSGSISEIVGKMEADGLIRREKDETDKRNQLLYLTEKGRAQAQENAETLQKQNELLFLELSEEEQEQLYLLLTKLLGSWRNTFDDSLFHHRKGGDSSC